VASGHEGASRDGGSRPKESARAFERLAKGLGASPYRFSRSKVDADDVVPASLSGKSHKVKLCRGFAAARITPRDRPRPSASSIDARYDGLESRVGVEPALPGERPFLPVRNTATPGSRSRQIDTRRHAAHSLTKRAAAVLLEGRANHPDTAIDPRASLRATCPPSRLKRANEFCHASPYRCDAVARALGRARARARGDLDPLDGSPRMPLAQFALRSYNMTDCGTPQQTHARPIASSSRRATGYAGRHWLRYPDRLQRVRASV